MSKALDKADILKYLKEHYPQFEKKYHVQKIGLFGSYARDEAKPDSDVDIFVQMHPSLYDIVAIKEQIEKDLNTKVDIIREHKNIKPFLLKMIQKDLIYV
jgi:hypothetical protein